jgi:hypothetical protein
MKTKITVLMSLAVLVSAQTFEDDFKCPDEFPGFYPHLISCDKYWRCDDGFAELRTCGNGLGFLDNDYTFTLEQCAELHLVECGDRNEIEPPISTDNCPRLFGTFPDPVDCGVFWKCQDGKSNRYNCPPGLAYDKVSRGCRWADQVPECSAPAVQIDDEGGEFQCPLVSTPGVFTKHAHPADCRQYFLCIGGIPREYGCPLGTVFDDVSGGGQDGKCSDPEAVPECASYYGDADLGDITRSGADTGPGDREDRPRPRPSVPRNVQRSQAALPRGPSPSVNKDQEQTFRDSGREKSRPAPPALQQIVDSDPSDRAQPPRPRPSRPESSRSQSQRTKGQFRPSENEIEEKKPATPSPTRLQQIRIDTTQRPAPQRLQVLTDRPNTRTTFPRRQEEERTTEQPTTLQRTHTTNSRFSTAGRPSSAFSLSQAATTASTPVGDDGLPAPVKAAPGPNGEEYYYYYYYYDDEEGKGGKALDNTPGS